MKVGRRGFLKGLLGLAAAPAAVAALPEEAPRTWHFPWIEDPVTGKREALDHVAYLESKTSWEIVDVSGHRSYNLGFRVTPEMAEEIDDELLAAFNRGAGPSLL